MSDLSAQIGPKRALIRSPDEYTPYKPRPSWRGSLFVRPEGELGGLSHPPPACPGGTPRAAVRIKKAPNMPGATTTKEDLETALI